MTTHSLRVPSPLDDMRTVCGLALAAAPKGDMITSLPEKTDCQPCRGMLGMKTDEDWNPGLPEVSEVQTSEDGKFEVTMKAHKLMTVMSHVFLETLDAANAPNYLEYAFVSPTRGETIVITVQRAEGLTPTQKLAQAEKERDQAVKDLDVLLDALANLDDLRDALAK